MIAFATKQEMLEALTDSLELDCRDREIAKIMATDKAVYVPHIYRGGWVVRGFGFSMERIGTYIPMERAGNPLFV